jgi:VanZ family protein
MAKTFFWAWLIILLALNIIPLGLETSRALSTRSVLNLGLFRLDYILHLISFLAYAWVFVLGQLRGRPVFRSHAVMKFVTLVLSTAMLFELIQLILPYRRFNPIDMGFNLAGAFLGIAFVCVSRRLAQKTSAD